MAINYQELARATEEYLRRHPSSAPRLLGDPPAPNTLGEALYPHRYSWDPAAPGADRTVVWSAPQAPGSFDLVDPPKPAFNTDHAWDMLVLAAKASRYG